jgi:hypothetical protein
MRDMIAGLVAVGSPDDGAVPYPGLAAPDCAAAAAGAASMAATAMAATVVL